MSFVVPYIVSISAMLFAASCLLTFISFVKHLDDAAEPTDRRATSATAFAYHDEVHEEVPA
jgi:hypothetical protein